MEKPVLKNEAKMHRKIEELVNKINPDLSGTSKGL